MTQTTWAIQAVRLYLPAPTEPRLTCLADYEILREGLKLARQLGETAPLKNTLTAETTPGSQVQTDDEWVAWLREAASSEYHPSSSCAMLPREQGGVVDANLRVYGLANVRVADASVVPIALSTHLMASTYGVAEQASNIIQAYYTNTSTTTSANASTTSATGSSSSDFSSLGANSSVSVHSSDASSSFFFSPSPVLISLGTVAASFVAFNALLLRNW